MTRLSVLLPCMLVAVFSFTSCSPEKADSKPIISILNGYTQLPNKNGVNSISDIKFLNGKLDYGIGT